MPDPESSYDIAVIVDKPCWKAPASQWETLIQPVVLETLRQSLWKSSAEINILLSDNVAVHELNKKFRGIDKPTNVLSFPSLEADEISSYRKEKTKDTIILGDIVLAFETLQQESLEQNILFEHHVKHLIVHGVLHLLGYDHQKEEDAINMESLEVSILSTLNIPNPYKEHDKYHDHD
ncbi:MAG: rRNA maturation RNase YbeY [Alphaproteobacteria bacterium]|nr:rRNA maturation RNase YbeY [Alphaproteobacteria bacterium]